MKRQDFTERYLIALYHVHRRDRSALASVESLKDHFDLPENNYLEEEVPEMLASRGWAQVHVKSGGPTNHDLIISMGGKEAAELLLEQGVNVALRGKPASADDENGSAEIAPAADRVVRFDHNEPQAQEIAGQIGEIEEAVRGRNDPAFAPDEKDRILRGLVAARQLWGACELKVIQLKVGVLMAVEDAADFLASTSRAIAATLLVDAIKAFAKTHLRIDLDHV